MIRTALKISVAVTGLGLSLILAGASIGPFSRNEKAFYADKNLASFVRPGLAITVSSAEIAGDGTISVTFAITDSAGAPLDRAGLSTPGAVSLSFIAAYIPQNSQQYVDYIVRS